MKKNPAGFSLLEVMVSIIIIGILTMMAMPSFKSNTAVQNQAVCIDQLRQIQWAKRRWEEQQTASGTFTAGTTSPTFSSAPATASIMGASGWIPTYTCPSGGTYAVNFVNQKATCTIAGHAIP